MFVTLIKRSALLSAVIALSACGAMDRIKNIGKAPELTPIQNVQAPPVERSISYPVASAEVIETTPNSLWRTGARAFFKDQRAARIGDILTVEINITDNASVANSTARARTSADDSSITNFFGLEAAIPKILPGGSNGTVGQAFDPAALTALGSTSSYTGNGTVDRSENIELQLAAIITDILPNGNLVIQGRQEVRVNFEKRELLLAGIVRPEDISSSNIVQHTKIAEARISYGGKGQLTDVQQPRYGTQLYDIIFPF